MSDTAIYGLAEPRSGEIRYVGQAVDPRARLAHHLWEARSDATTHKCNWLRSIDLQPVQVILAWVPANEADAAERLWMDRFDNLTNHAPGGTKPPMLIGENNPRTRLLDVDVVAIRNAASAGTPLAVLAKRFGVTAASITQIVAGQTRRTAGGPTRPPRARTRLSDVQVAEIRHLVAAGHPQTEVAAKFGVSQPHVSDLASGKRRSQKDV